MKSTGLPTIASTLALAAILAAGCSTLQPPSPLSTTEVSLNSGALQVTLRPSPDDAVMYVTNNIGPGAEVELTSDAAITITDKRSPPQERRLEIGISTSKISLGELRPLKQENIATLVDGPSHRVRISRVEDFYGEQYKEDLPNEHFIRLSLKEAAGQAAEIWHGDFRYKRRQIWFPRWTAPVLRLVSSSEVYKEQDIAPALGIGIYQYNFDTVRYPYLRFDAVIASLAKQGNDDRDTAVGLGINVYSIGQVAVFKRNGEWLLAVGVRLEELIKNVSERF